MAQLVVVAKGFDIRELQCNIAENIGAIRLSTYLLSATCYREGASNHQLQIPLVSTLN
jgi:hypothetical protein